MEMTSRQNVVKLFGFVVDRKFAARVTILLCSISVSTGVTYLKQQ